MAVAAVSFAGALSASADALTVNGARHETNVVFNAPAGNTIASDNDVELSPPGGVFTRTLSSFIAGNNPIDFYEANAGMQPSGFFGVSGIVSGAFDSLDPAELAFVETRVRIINDATNTQSSPIDITMDFIVNGGRFQLTADEFSTLGYSMEVGEFANTPQFVTGGTLTGTPSFGATFSATGADIGAMVTGTGVVEIPFSVHTVTFPNVLPGETVSISYGFRAFARINVAEHAEWGFRDPATISGMVVPMTQVAIASTPSQSVPAPGGLAVVASGLALAGVLRRRRAAG